MVRQPPNLINTTSSRLNCQLHYREKVLIGHLVDAGVLFVMKLSSYAAAVLSLLSTTALGTDSSSRPPSSKLLLPRNFPPPQVFRNVNLVHIVNLEKSYPREAINVVIENISKEPQDEYYIPFTKDQMERIGSVEVKDKKDVEAPSFLVEAAEIDMERYGVARTSVKRVANQDSETQFYRIKLNKPLQPKAQQTLGITFFYLSALSPSPPTINQAHAQNLVYQLSAYCPSSYQTAKQKTEVKFPSSMVSSATELPEVYTGPKSPQKAGNKYTYGPYTDVPPGTYEAITVRYELTKPIIHVTRLERDIEVSHWGGNVAFEERYEMTNFAATLAKHFSRVEWNAILHYNTPTTAIKSLNFPLQAGSQDAYYTDVIGNISTSHWRSNRREAHLEIKPRYPVFGGWNYPFRIGWNSDAARYIRNVPSTSSYILQVPLIEGPKLSEGLQYALVQTRIVLPEGAKILDWSSSLTIDPEDVVIGTHKTFMDTIGRTTLTLTRRGLNDESRDRMVYIRYELDFASRIRKPAMIGAAVMAVFAGAWAIGNIHLGIKA